MPLTQLSPACEETRRKQGLTMTQYVYRFGGGVSDGGKGDKNLLGGKGANLAEMASIGLPVPPGFTISTEFCAVYYDEGKQFPAGSARRGRDRHRAYRAGDRQEVRRRGRPVAGVGALAARGRRCRG